LEAVDFKGLLKNYLMRRRKMHNNIYTYEKLDFAPSNSAQMMCSFMLHLSFCLSIRA